MLAAGPRFGSFGAPFHQDDDDTSFLEGQGFNFGQDRNFDNRGTSAHSDSEEESESFLPNHKKQQQSSRSRGLSQKKVLQPVTEEQQYGRGVPPKKHKPRVSDRDRSYLARQQQANMSRRNTRGNNVEKIEQLEKDNAEKEKENEDLKRRIAGLEKAGTSNKKQRSDFKGVPVDFYKGTCDEIKRAIKLHVAPTVKFLANQDEEKKVLFRALKHVPSEWKKFENLNDEDKLIQLDRHFEKYGDASTKHMNYLRNQTSSAVKTQVVKDISEGNLMDGKMLLKVALRPAELLLKLPEKHKNGQPHQRNIAKNKENRKYRRRFLSYLNNYLPMMHKGNKSIWDPPQRIKHTLSKYTKNGLKKEFVVPAAQEAMLIVLIENSYEKWMYHVDREKKTGLKIDAWKKKCKEKNVPFWEPPTVYSDNKGGNDRYGGWSEAGRLRFKKVRAMIVQARKQETTPEVEEFYRKEMIRVLSVDNNKKEAPKIPKEVVPKTAVGFGDDEEEDLAFEGYDSEEEIKALKARQKTRKASLRATTTQVGVSYEADDDDQQADDDDQQESPNNERDDDNDGTNNEDDDSDITVGEGGGDEEGGGADDEEYPPLPPSPP